MNYLKAYLLSLPLLIASFCSAEEATLMASMANDPSVLIQNQVNAITGEPVIFETDLVIQGAEPIRISRAYICQRVQENSTWQLVHTFAKVEGDPEQKEWVVSEKNGCPVLYLESKIKINGKTVKRYVPDLGVGYSNTAQGISSRTNLKNNTIEFSDDNSRFTFTAADGTKREYKRMIHQKIEDDDESFAWASYRLLSEQLPNGSWILYEYDHVVDKKHKLDLYNLASIRTTNPSKSKTYATARLIYEDPKQKNLRCIISGSDGQSVEYQFDADPKTGRPTILANILRSHGPDQALRQVSFGKTFSIPDKHEGKNLHWEMNCQRLQTIAWPLARCQQIQYYQNDIETVAGQTVQMADAIFSPKYSYGNWVSPAMVIIDPRRNRVKTLAAPTGSDSTPQITHSFIYEPSVTSVTDHAGVRTEYRWSKDFRLQTIERFDRENHLINAERFTWGNSALTGHLISKSFLDGERKAICCRQYVYNTKGDITEERFYGNLSGQGAPLILDDKGLPTDNGCECCTRRFRYSEGEPSLLLDEEREGSLRIAFTYLPNTDLKTSELTYDTGHLILRKFFIYDEDHVLIREIEDDGSSMDMNNFADVQVRTVRAITPWDAGPYIGMPQIIEEKYWDENGEHLLKKMVITYTTGGRIAQKDFYDANNQLRYSLKTTYDAKGRPIEQTNALGHIETFSYDACGNPIASSSPRQRRSIDYDFMNRPIAQRLIGDDKLSLEARSIYDNRGNLIQEIDAHGCKTSHLYNSLNRCIETFEPHLMSFSGQSIPCITRHIYDSAGYETACVDTEGNQTKTHRNAYGQPTLVIHPDGAREEYIYHCDGALRFYIDAQGIQTSTLYDGLRRVIAKTISSPNEKLSEERFAYKGAQLISHIDAEGHETIYGYDGAGRKISEECNGEKTLYSYDSLGRLHCIQNGNLCQITEYDLLDRIIEEREESSGNLTRRTCYSWDAAGDRTTVLHFLTNQVSRQENLYDSIHRLIQTKDALGHIETITYDDQTTNAAGEHVLQKTHRDPLGLQTIETFDTHGQLAIFEKRKSQPLLRQEKFYDGSKHLIDQTDTIFSSTEPSRLVHTHWIYDERGRLRELHEAEDSPELKITRHRYTPQGFLAQTVKPSGAILSYIYDGLNHLISLESSDGTVRHHMSYDRLGHMLASDGIRRTYDAKGRLLSESFPNGLSIENSFDSQGRKRSCQINPADCLIEYAYCGNDLSSVSRKNNNGQLLYTHRYQERDLAGNLMNEELIDGSSLHFSVDILSRKTKIDSTHFVQEVLETDPVGNIRSMRTQNQNSAFDYDDLYQLTTEEGLFSGDYRYDSIGCRLEKNGERYAVNSLHQLTSHFTYDPNGNPIRQGDTSFTYDALDRLIRIESSLFRQDFTYDSLHRCLSHTISQNGTQKSSYYLYDGQNEIGSFDDSLHLQDLRILGEISHAEIGAAVAIELQEKVFVPIHDLQGNVAALVSLNSSNMTNYRYSAFGEEKIDGEVLSPWRFSSKRTDANTSLVYFGRRFYSPAFGRWLTPDPAGFTDGMNLYAFVHNDPLTHFDEYGLWLEPRPPGSFNSSQAFQYMVNPLIDMYNHPRFQGSMQAFGGLVETGIGAGMTYGTGGISPLGWALMAHGLDHTITGMNTAIFGRPRDTVTSQLLQQTGMSSRAAGLMDNGISFIGTMGGAAVIRAGQASSLPNYSLSMPTTSPSLRESSIGNNEFPKSQWRFPENPDKLLKELPRDRRGYIYATENLRIRPEKHPLDNREVFNARHHGQHYHVEVRLDTTKSWSNPNNVIKLKPMEYKVGQGTGFIPGEFFPGATE